MKFYFQINVLQQEQISQEKYLQEIKEEVESKREALKTLQDVEKVLDEQKQKREQEVQHHFVAIEEARNYLIQAKRVIETIRHGEDLKKNSEKDLQDL